MNPIECITRTRIYQVGSIAAIPDILRELKSENFTGKVTFNIANGGVNSVSVEQKVRSLHLTTPANCA